MGEHKREGPTSWKDARTVVEHVPRPTRAGERPFDERIELSGLRSLANRVGVCLRDDELAADLSNETRNGIDRSLRQRRVLLISIVVLLFRHRHKLANAFKVATCRLRWPPQL